MIDGKMPAPASRPERVFRVLDLINRIATWAVAALSVSTIALTLFEVVARRLFGAPTIWSSELVTMLASTLFVGGWGAALQYDQHVKIDIFVSRASARFRNAVLAIIFLFAMVPTTSVITTVTAEKALAAWATGALKQNSHWEPLLWPYLFALTLALVLFVLQLVLQGIRHALALEHGSVPESVYRSAPKMPW